MGQCYWHKGYSSPSTLGMIPDLIRSSMRLLLSLGMWTLLVMGQIAWASPQTIAPDSIIRHTDTLLALEVEGETFFRNNEYEVSLGRDYTLPGYRLRINLDYTPSSRHRVRLRAGVINHHYWGASLYPAAPFYSDLPYWTDEGEGYSRLRLKPFVQASILLHPSWELTLGSLHGGIAHRLIEPLYNPELRWTADHETGIQLRHHGPRLSLDTWVDWRSFIFRRARHQEAFISGLRVDYLLVQRDNWRLSLRGQAIWTHRGGVENIVPDTVHTWSNTALGIRYDHSWQTNGRPRHASLSVYRVGYTQRGAHYASPSGCGGYIEGSMSEGPWEVGLAGWFGRGYMGVLSTPFVQSSQLRERNNTREKRPTSAYLQLRASYDLIERQLYTLGCRGMLWLHPSGSSSAMEVYLSIRPRFRLLRDH